jgi:hypothetical protein
MEIGDLTGLKTLDLRWNKNLRLKKLDLRSNENLTEFQSRSFLSNYFTFTQGREILRDGEIVNLDNSIQGEAELN